MTRHIVEERELNTDPITGEAGAHPVGAGIGAAAAGAASGAILASAARPIGMVAGIVVGGVAEALAGRPIAESMSPTVEERHSEMSRPGTLQLPTPNRFAYRAGLRPLSTPPENGS
jgi:hypothetical protein